MNAEAETQPRRRRASSPLLVSGAVLAVVVMAALFAPWLAPHDPLAIPPGDARLGPSSEHWFGTDQQGRDVFARILYGGRTSLMVGLGSAAFAMVIGIVVGAAAGLRRSWVDGVLMRVTDVFFVLPTVVLAACLALALGRSTWAIVLAVALTAWPQIARVVRAAVLEISQSLYVQASRSAGLSERTVFRVHFLPRILRVVLSLGIAGVAVGILTEASLSYLAIGVSEPAPSWGLMIAGGKRFLVSAPHIVLFPAGAIVVTVGCLVVMHEALTRGGGQDG
jgi:ABC-type dipeptide/oligopeptide/nickel transport system permease subunit